MKKSIAGILVAALSAVAVAHATPTFSYLGCELSQGDGMNKGLNWGDSTTTGYKAAWRSTDTPQKAFVFDGEANAYGRDGYLCFWTGDSSQGILGTSFDRALYSGTWAGNNTFTDFAPYVSSIEVLNFSGIGNNDGSSQFDNPSLGIGADVEDVQSGTLFCRFYDGSVVETNTVLRLTFANNVAAYPRIRVGCVVAHGGQAPRSIQVGDAVGVVCGTDQYGWFDWYFFEIDGAAAGDVVDIKLEENRESGSASIDAFVIDAPTPQNSAPVISDIYASHQHPTFSEGSALTMLTVTASDADNDTLSYQWSCANGRDAFVTFDTPTSATCPVTLHAIGDFVFTARISDGIAAPVYTNITVRAEPLPGAFYVEYMGYDLSSAQRGNNGAAGWGTSTTTGAKSAWRSTNTAPKAFVLPGEDNAYGRDGYICFATSEGNLTSGFQTDNLFKNVAPYVSSIAIDNLNTYAGNDGNAQIDDPRQPIGEDLPSIRSGAFFLRFYDASVQETNRAFSITFADNVAHYPVIRVGVVNAYAGQTPAAIICDTSIATMTGVSWYGYYNWYFFDIHNAQPGQTVDFYAVENALQGSASIEMVTFDAPTLSNSAPVISALESDPAQVPFLNGSGSASLSVVATDADNNPLTYHWASVDGRDGSVSLATPDAADCDATFAGVGDFTFMVSVSDGIAAPVTSNITVRVEPPAGSFYVEYVGKEHSTNRRDNNGAAGWGASPDSGAKSAWRSTNTAPKAFVLPGEPNAYGEEGYICFCTSHTDAPFTDGTIYTGTRYSGGVSNIAPFVASFELLNCAQIAGNDGGAQIDNPLLGIGDDIPSIRSGAYVVNFTNPSEQETKPAFRATFGDSVEYYPLVRVGFAISYFGQTPGAISCAGAVAQVSGVVNYGTYDWYFFDIHNAAPGQSIDFDILERTVQGSGFIDLVTFDAVAPVNGLPEISAVSASPATPVYHNGYAATTLGATVSDPDDNPLALSWSADGNFPGLVTMATPGAAECAVTFGAPGTYKFKFTASDGIGTPVVTNISVTVAAPDNELYVSYAGTDITTTTDIGAAPGGWGSATTGYKRDFRTATAGNGDAAKDFVLAGNVNAYGVDGYIFPGNSNTAWPYSNGENLGQIFTGTGHEAVNGFATVFSNVTDYVTAFEFTAQWGGGDGQFHLGDGDMTFIDDPRAEPGADPIADICAGDCWITTQGSDYYPLARIVFNSKAAHRMPIRIGFLTGRGEMRKPTHYALGGTVGEYAGGVNSYYFCDWTFFDVHNAKAGDVLEFDIRNIVNNTTTIQGIVFDSIDTTPHGTILLLR